MTTSPNPTQSPVACQPGRLKRSLKWVERLSIAAMAVGVFMVASPTTYWLYLKLDCQQPLRRADYIICLGGDPYRVLEGVTLLKEGLADKLVLSNFGAAALAMQDQAIAWGAPGDKIVLDTSSHRTADHPAGARKYAGIEPADDVCIVVTSYSHMARSKACFEKAGYKHIIMREPRWERRRATPGEYRHGYWIFPRLLYEYAAWAEYWVMGYV